jgi:hypothetical protein
MQLPKYLPRSVAPHRAQVEHGLRARLGPAHPGWFHAIFHQMSTGTFDASRANRPALGAVLVIVHKRVVAPIIADRTLYGLPLGRRACRIVEGVKYIVH